MLTELDGQITKAMRFNGLGTAVISTARHRALSRYLVGNLPVPRSRPDRSRSGNRGSRTSPLYLGSYSWDRSCRDSPSLQFPAAFALPPFPWCAAADYVPQQTLHRAAAGGRGGTGRGAHWDAESVRSRVVAARAGGGALTWRVCPGRVPPLPPPALLAGKMAAVRRARRDSRCVVRFSDRELC